MRFWVITIVLPAIVGLAWAEPDYQSWFRDDHFLMDGLMQVATADLNADGRDELLLSGRDYIDRQVKLHIFDGLKTPFEPVWTSENVMEDKSPVQLVTGKFKDNTKQMALIMTNRRMDLFGWVPEQGYQRVSTMEHKLFPGETAAVDWDGDGRDELLLIRVAKAGTKHYYERPEIYQVEEQELKLISIGPEMGNVRSVTAGDLDGDGRDEVIFEEGVASKTGVFKLFGPGSSVSEWKLRWGPGTVVPAPIYGMTITADENETYLLAASERGKLTFVRWEKGSLVSGKSVGFSAGLVSVAAGNFGESIGVVLIAYPQSLRILTKMGEPSNTL